MTPSPHFPTRVAHGAALAAVVIGGVVSAVDIVPSTFVREFQAGEPSGWGEKLYAILVRAGIEGLGFGLLGFALAAVAVGLARLARPRADATGEQRAARSSTPAANLLLVAAVFAVWEGFGAWLAGELLPFLTTGQVLLLDLGAIGGLLVLVLLFRAVVARLALTPRDAPVALALGCLAALALAALVALEIVTAESGGWRSPLRLGLAAACFAAVVPAAALLARTLSTLAELLGRQVGGATRLRLEPALAKRIVRAGDALLVVAIVALFSTALLSPEGEAGAAATEDTLVQKPSSPARSGDAAESSLPGPRAVVFVTVDTLRADHLSCYGYPRETSPFLDSVAGEGTRFAAPSAAASWTKPATGTLLTGLYPSRHGALYHGSRLRLPEGERTLAEAFRDAGYATAGFVTNPNIKRIFEFDRGFDEYFDAPVEDTLLLAALRESRFGTLLKRLTRRQWNWKYANDVFSMNAHVMAWLEENSERPFFLYIHYIDPHEPYEPPRAYAKQWVRDHGLVLQNERKRLVGQDLYDAEIRYTDDGLAQLVGALEEHGLWDDTLFVLTSDHGEEWFEHGILGHGYSLRESVVGVPLILRGPGVPAGRVVERPVQILDLPATLLELARTGVNELGDGHSFAQLLGANEAELGDTTADVLFLENEFGEDDDDWRSFVFTGAREGPWKLVKTEQNAYVPNAPEWALFNLEEDPEERINRFDDEDEIVRDVRARLLARLLEHGGWLDEHGLRGHGPPVQMDAATEAQLRALGYL